MSTAMAPAPSPVKTDPLNVRMLSMSKHEILREILHSLVAAAQSDEAYEHFRQFLASFRKYSFFNRLMLFAQYPSGSQFASGKEWKDHNRWIAKGVKACRVYKPKMGKTLVRDTAGNPIVASDGTLQYQEHVIGWNLVPVYAYEQTVAANDAKDVVIPSYQSIVSDDPYAVQKLLASACKEDNIDVRFRHLDFENESTRDENIIVINTHYDIQSQNYTLVKEACRSYLKELPAEKHELALSVATQIVAMSLGTPRSMLRTLDIIRLTEDTASAAIAAVDKVMKHMENVRFR